MHTELISQQKAVPFDATVQTGAYFWTKCYCVRNELKIGGLELEWFSLSPRDPRANIITAYH